MKNLFLSLLMVIGSGMTFGLNLIHTNPEFRIEESNGFSLIRLEGQYLWPEISGTPAIPLQSLTVEIPTDQKVEGISGEFIDTAAQELAEELFPLQRQLPLSETEPANFIQTVPGIYSSPGLYPDEIIYNYETGWLGEHQILTISFYSFRYEPTEKLIEYPRQIAFNISLSPVVTTEHHPDNHAVSQIGETLGLDLSIRNDFRGYLLITPSQFSDSYQPLLDWRQSQGVGALQVLVQDIESGYPGEDLQEKIRNCIIDYCDSYNISFVTLGADVAFIPDRKVFAFDCEYGSHDDENDIPCDMYYSCLDGNWNANGNDIFGEEGDEVDYYPEVFVSRISANNSQDVEDYVSRLLAYEKGTQPEYKKAGGMSMELWQGSNSEICQQYIYDQYFPDDFQIEFLFDEENNEENVIELINANQNIIQHTGHAGRYSMSLESGHINSATLELIDNDYGGIFYSIGCWSSALDYDSIGEKLVMTPGKGQLGYIGNSRYGWGAPSAPGFGFSEFFQKEFFRLIFQENNTVLSQTNACQKLPFIPYFSGTSVYKWCAYQLNAVGDSYFNLIVEDPPVLECIYDYSVELGGNCRLWITSNSEPVSYVAVYHDSQLYQTNMSGYISFYISDPNKPVNFYKYGFQALEVDLNEGMDSPYLAGPYHPWGYFLDWFYLHPGIEYLLFYYLVNPTDEDFEFIISLEYDESYISVEHEDYDNTVLADSYVTLPVLEIELLPVEIAGQLEFGTKMEIVISILDPSTEEMITSIVYSFYVDTPDLRVTGIEYGGDGFSAGGEYPIELNITNLGSSSEGVIVNYQADPLYLSLEENEQQFYLQFNHNDYLEIDNVLNFTEAFTDNKITPLDVTMITTKESQVYHFTDRIYLAAGEFSFLEDFETEPEWDHDPEWQQVSTYAQEGTFSFSCRPEEPGFYSAVCGDFIYLPDHELSFWYRYKMPMYGEDGVYFLLNRGSICDTLLFLGAGGALSLGESRPIEAYIEGDWALYVLQLDQVLPDEPEVGTIYNFELLFKYAEVFEGFNQYDTMEEIGVFIDDFQLGFHEYENSGFNAWHDDETVTIYPNPVTEEDDLIIKFNIRDVRPNVSIYNIRGQKVRSGMAPRDEDQTYYRFIWDKKDDYKKKVAAGIYFIRLDLGNRQLMKKVVILETREKKQSWEFWD